MDPSNMENKLFASPLQIGGILKKVKISEIVSGWSHILVKTGNIEECVYSVSSDAMITLLFSPASEMIILHV